MLTGRCNLACSYCYAEDGRPARAMSAETVERAFESVFASGVDDLAVEFTGGEPLLRFGLIKDAVEIARAHAPPSCNVDFSLTTNGTLLDDAMLAYLFDHDVSVRLSFDGVAAAQDLRKVGTFVILDRLLHRLRRDFPEQLRSKVSVSVTLVAPAIRYLASSVRYLVRGGVATIGIGPRLTWDPDWHERSREELEREVDEIVTFSADLWRRTGRVPVGFLARAPLRDRAAPGGRVLCRAFAGSAICVAPDRRACVCPLFSRFLAPQPPLAERVARTADLGSVEDGTLARRLASLPRRARSNRVVSNRRDKHSSSGSCARCRFLPDCNVCPASICHIPGNRDPDLVPDSICAFNQVTLAARERFDELTDGEVSEAWYREMRAALGRVESALKIPRARSQSARQVVHRRGTRSRR